ncbi:sugar ABC transporter ATP-binding protein [Limnochorda pilosa]|uniref:D-ribose transporter ATP binding protein n=1 Tax=Limnochorda pilosa TaxID=1555112 RepID=A0A0K2SLS1_LIMPI|nr:sugar ABC transporter ATP-binding protein [Limnochorda pilosa]BAS27957.1 D-ribose transporter ATP binding protein [Limnochorda pilosa]
MSAILELRKVSKRFGGVQALQDVSFTLEEGHIHGLVGENGAGKSTLIKILGGVYAKDAGEVLFQGATHQPATPAEAQRSGISVVHQEIPLCPNLTVAQNVFLGHPILKRGGRADWAEMERRTAELFSLIGQTSIDPRRVVGRLSVAEQQLTCIVQALSQQCRLLILDEPTAALTPGEVETLFDVLRKLRAEGTTILFVSHILSEVMEITDRVTVLRNGRHVATTPTAQLTTADVVRMMVGEMGVGHQPSAHARPSSDVVLEVRDLGEARSGLHGVSFELHRQEVLGIAGIQGAGRTELGLCLFGVTPATEGEIRLQGQPVRVTSPRQAIDLGIGYLTEDRRNLGLFWEMNVEQNLVAVIIDRLRRAFGRWDRRAARERGEEAVKGLDIRTAGLHQGIRFLSGGNQQKVLLARWLSADPSILILDEPTRGIDVGSKAEIRRLIRSLVERGVSVILISSDLDELLALSDRVIVMSRRRVSGTLSGSEATRERVMALATAK